MLILFVTAAGCNERSLSIKQNTCLWGGGMSNCRDGATDCQSGGDGGDVCDDDRAFALGLTEIALTRMLRYVIQDTTKGFALEVRTIRIAHKV